jgi:hypothetical protein
MLLSLKDTTQRSLEARLVRFGEEVRGFVHDDGEPLILFTLARGAYLTVARLRRLEAANPATNLWLQGDCCLEPSELARLQCWARSELALAPYARTRLSPLAA